MLQCSADIHQYTHVPIIKNITAGHGRLWEESQMLDAIGLALVELFSGWTVLYLLLGVLLGLVIGVLPALGATAGMALLVPFVFDMEPQPALAMMIGLMAVVATGDTVTSVLLGIPGATSSQATVLDGFPLAKKGQAARALSAAYFSSMIGGVFGAMVLTAVILVARPIVLSFGMGELLLLVLLGLTMVSVLSGPSLIKGLVACGMGMLLGSIGMAPGTGQERMIIGDLFYLLDGFQLPVVALAVFAFPEIISLLRRGEAIAESPPMGRGWLQGVIDTWRNRWLTLRCSVVGCIIGALPIGGSDWIAYGHAVQSCKPRENFGKGDIRGVIAPEAANNANAGGALIPTLIFGIPGSGSTAVFLGGLILLGFQPGPDMIDDHLDVTYLIIWSLALANIFGAGICFLVSGQMAKLTAVRFVYLAPFLLTVVFFGAFQSSRQWGDLVSLFVLGVFALYMRRFGYPRPAFLIGFVLQNHLEGLLFRTIQIYSLESLFSRPLMWVLLAVIAASLWFGLKYRPKINTEGKSDRPVGLHLWPQYLFLLFVMGVAIYAIVDVWDRSLLTYVFPMTAGFVTLAFATAGLWQLSRPGADNALVFDSEYGSQKVENGFVEGPYHYVLWVAGFMLSTYLIGFILSIFLFFAVFLSVKSPARPLAIAIMAISATAVLCVISYVFVVDFPSGLLQTVVPLPWPIN
jgi:putative tricarboxylic transport membrane protein